METRLVKWIDRSGDGIRFLCEEEITHDRWLMLEVREGMGHVRILYSEWENEKTWK